ncbi:MAG: hypothetical protein RIR01_1730 [Bacteroidota bacterium]
MYLIIILIRILKTKIDKSIEQKKTFQLLETFLWEEQDSNLRRFPNGFTVRPRWPLEYLPML